MSPLPLPFALPETDEDVVFLLPTLHAASREFVESLRGWVAVGPREAWDGWWGVALPDRAIFIEAAGPGQHVTPALMRAAAWFVQCRQLGGRCAAHTFGAFRCGERWRPFVVVPRVEEAPCSTLASHELGLHEQTIEFALSTFRDKGLMPRLEGHHYRRPEGASELAWFGVTFDDTVEPCRLAAYLASVVVSLPRVEPGAWRAWGAVLACVVSAAPLSWSAVATELERLAPVHVRGAALRALAAGLVFAATRSRDSSSQLTPQCPP